MMKIKISLILTLLILFSGGVTKAQEGWFTLFSEYAVTTSYTGLQFINGNTGYMSASWGNEHNNGGFTQKTTNGGLNWFSVESSVARYGLFFLNEQTGWTFGGYWDDAGKRSREVFRTTNGGINFQRVFIDSLQQSFRRMYFADVNTGWITTFSNLIKSTNSGINWSIISNLSLYSIHFTDANTGWGVTATGIIYKTINGGLNWFSQNPALGSGLVDIKFINSNTGWACGSTPNIYKTTNAGTNWTAYGTGIQELISSIEFVDSLHGWVSSSLGQIKYTSNGGVNWIQQISDTNYYFNNLSFPNQLTGYVLGTHFSTPYNHDNFLLKTTTGGTVFVQKIGSEVPQNFSLSQNYPNPFNPVTKIKFSLPNPSKGGAMDVQLTVYDVLGREVSILFSSPSGRTGGATYEVEWDGSNYPSGVYFYKLTVSDASSPLANPLSITKKMVLIK